MRARGGGQRPGPGLIRGDRRLAPGFVCGAARLPRPPCDAQRRTPRVALFIIPHLYINIKLDDDNVEFRRIAHFAQVHGKQIKRQTKFTYVHLYRCKMSLSWIDASDWFS